MGSRAPGSASHARPHCTARRTAGRRGISLPDLQLTRLSAHRGFHHNHPKLDGTSRLSSDRRTEQPRAPRQQPAAGEWAAESRERTDARGSAPQAQTPGAGARAARRAQAAEPPCRAQERRRVASSARPNPGNLTAQSGPRSAQIRRARDLGRSRGDEPCNVRVPEPLPGGADSVAVEKRGVPDAGGRRSPWGRDSPSDAMTRALWAEQGGRRRRRRLAAGGGRASLLGGVTAKQWTGWSDPCGLEEGCLRGLGFGFAW